MQGANLKQCIVDLNSAASFYLFYLYQMSARDCTSLLCASECCCFDFATKLAEDREYRNIQNEQRINIK